MTSWYEISKEDKSGLNIDIKEMIRHMNHERGQKLSIDQENNKT
jgi:hypothetical protein